MTVTRDDLIVAVDGVIGSLLALRKLIEHAEDEPAVDDPLDWRGPCPDRDDQAHRVVWGETMGGEQQGVCRDCGTEFVRPAPPDVVGVSGLGDDVTAP